MTTQRQYSYEDLRIDTASYVDATRKFIASVALGTRSAALSLIQANDGARETSRGVVRNYCNMVLGQKLDVWAPFLAH